MYNLLENIIWFIFQVMLDEAQTEKEGEKIAHEIMNQLGIKNDDLVAGAYMDFLMKKN